MCDEECNKECMMKSVLCSVNDKGYLRDEECVVQCSGKGYMMRSV